MDRYSIIHEKNPREIVLLRGRGCVYQKCTFCDYHLDRCTDDEENYALNRDALLNVTGRFGQLEVINSGSVFELDDKTLELIYRICAEKGIHTIHFESHYLYRDRIPALRERFKPFTLKMKLGLETFDYDLRERVLRKGIPDREPEIIGRAFDEANLLFGISGQTAETMEQDIVLGLAAFERLCVNIMCENTTAVRPDGAVVDSFVKNVYPKYRDDERVDILLNNTDFGVGD